MTIILKILGAWLMADFISGLSHWWEDRALLGESRYDFINGVREDNERHHLKPAALLENSWWGNINTTAPLVWPFAFLFGYFGMYFWATTFLFLGFGNLIHRWSHENKSYRPALVTACQRIGLMSSPSHHSGHHFKMGRKVRREDSDIRFCVMSDWLNPILDGVNFFGALNWIAKFFLRDRE